MSASIVKALMVIVTMLFAILIILIACDNL